MIKHLFSLLVACLLISTGPSFSQAARPVYENLAPLAFQQELNRNKALLLDVRTASEFAQGHIKGAVNLDFYTPDFRTRLKAFATKRTVLVYCASGGRSAKAAQWLNELQAAKVYNLDGGIKAWQKAGLPVQP